jgi:hypothetical protein
MADIAPTQSTQDIDAAWEQWRLRLLAHFDALAERGLAVELYLLVDTRGTPGLNELLPKVPSLSWCSLWTGSVLETYADIAPYLIHLERSVLDDPRDLACRLARRVWMEGASSHNLTWIWSPFGLQTLGDHFRYHTQYAIPDKRAFFLHFYDNRILERLRQVWAEEEGSAFIEPCNELWYRSRDLSGSVWTNGNEPVHSLANIALQMSAEQHCKLLVLGQADKLAMQLRERYGTRLDEYSDIELHDRIVWQLDRAHHYRVSDDDDFFNYVSKGIVLSPRFDEHPVIQQRLTRAKDGEISHRDALSQFDPLVLREVAQLESNGSEAVS